MTRMSNGSTDRGCDKLVKQQGAGTLAAPTPCSFNQPPCRLAGGDVVRDGGTDAAPTWLGCVLLGRGIAGRDVQRRWQTISVDAIVAGRSLDHRGRLPPWATTTARRQRRIGIEDRLRPLLQILPRRNRFGAMLAGYFGLWLESRLRLIERVVALRIPFGAIGGTRIAVVAIVLTTGTLAPLSTRLVATPLARAILSFRALLPLRAFLPLGLPFRALLPLGTLRPFETLLPLGRSVATVLPLGIALLAGTDRLTLVAIFVVAIEILRGAALLRLILEPAALVAQHPEIMVGELEIIFGVHPVALTLRIRREVLVLLVKLVRIAARAIVDAIAVVGTTLTALTRAATVVAAAATVATATAPSLLLPIIDQACRPLPVTLFQRCSGLSGRSPCPT